MREHVESLLKIDKNNLPEEIAAFPLVFSWWRRALAETYNKEREAKLDVKRKYAYASSLGRTSLASQGIKVTEKSVEEFACDEQEYTAAVNEHLKWESKVSILEGLIESMRQKYNIMLELLKIRKSE